MTFLTLENGKLTAYVHRGEAVEKKVTVETLEQAQAVFEEDGEVYGSSSLDSPQEYTKDVKVLSLVRKVWHGDLTALTA